MTRRSPEMRRRLFLFGGVEGRDPLDPLAPLLSALARRREIVDARRGAALSLRAVARSFRAGEDEALQDLTAPDETGDPRIAARIAPGATLLSAHRPMEPVGTGGGRSWRTPLDLSGVAVLREAVVGVDAAPPIAGRTISRFGLVKQAAGNGLAIFGDAPALYAALLALRAAGSSTGPVTLIAPTKRDAAEATKYAAWLEVGARVAAAETRAARAGIAMVAAFVIEAAPSDWPGHSDAVAAARIAGRPAVRVDWRLDGAAERIAAALAEVFDLAPMTDLAGGEVAIEASVDVVLAATGSARAHAARRAAAA